MADYPDWTSLAQIVGTDIMVAVDIQGGYIMLPVDIQAQYITLEIDIVAQTVGNITVDIAAQTVGNISINIAASAVTLNMNLQSSSITLNVNLHAQTANINVDIKASSVTLTVSVSGTANISVTAQTVGIYLQPDWSALQGADKNFTSFAVNKARGASTYASYTVPAGKTLFICGMSFYIYAVLDADGDKSQIGQALLYDQTAGLSRASLGGNGGGAINFSKPIVFAANTEIRLYIYNYANHNCNIGVTAHGYEV